MEKRRLPGIRRKNCIYQTWMCLLPTLLIACSGSLGKIQLENVNAVITESEAAIAQARLANAQSLAPQTLQRAENTLAEAKEAVQAKNGLEAMSLAYESLTHAQMAEQAAIYKSQSELKEDGLNAIIKRKESKIAQLQAALRKAETALEEARTDIQKLDMRKSQLQAEMDRKVEEIGQKHRETLRDYSTAKTELAHLASKLDATQTQLLKAQSQTEEHERQIEQLRRQLERAQSMVEEARKEVEEARTKATTQVQSYSRQIERLNRSNGLKQREDVLAQKRQEAKAYVQRQGMRQPVRTGSTSLSSQQIANGRAVINDWALAWTAKDINQHLSEYTQDVAVEQTLVRSSSEKQTYLNRMQMVNALKKMVDARWKETDSKFEADGESVIGTYRFSRLSQDTASREGPALYDVWTREVWTRQVGVQWKIFRETWRIYEAVPKYATIFN